MSAQNLEAWTMTLIPGAIIMESETELTQYDIIKWDLVERDPEDRSAGVEMVILFKRRIEYELFVTFLPSFLLMLITYATTYFPGQYFEASLAVNLTTMLMMTTIFTRDIF